MGRARKQKHGPEVTDGHGVLDPKAVPGAPGIPRQAFTSWERHAPRPKVVKERRRRRYGSTP